MTICRRPIAAALMTAFLLSAAQAETLCLPEDAMLRSLDHKFGEASYWRGVGFDGSLWLMTRNDETGSWTLLKILPDGNACLMADGEASEVLPVGTAT